MKTSFYGDFSSQVISKPSELTHPSLDPANSDLTASSERSLNGCDRAKNMQPSREFHMSIADSSDTSGFDLGSPNEFLSMYLNYQSES